MWMWNGSMANLARRHVEQVLWPMEEKSNKPKQKLKSYGRISVNEKFIIFKHVSIVCTAYVGNHDVALSL